MSQVVEYSLTVSNLHIIDSCQIPGRDFREILTHISDENPESFLFKARSICPMSLEWATHNFLYMIGYQRERTCDVDLDYPQKWYYRIAYPIIGSLVWVFIR